MKALGRALDSATRKDESDRRRAVYQGRAMSGVRIAVIDYGMGNLRSVEKACIHAGFDACVTDSPQKIDDATHVILPGVGAVGDALRRLRKRAV